MSYPVNLNVDASYKQHWGKNKTQHIVGQNYMHLYLNNILYCHLIITCDKIHELIFSAGYSNN